MSIHKFQVQKHKVNDAVCETEQLRTPQEYCMPMQQLFLKCLNKLLV